MIGTEGLHGSSRPSSSLLPLTIPVDDHNATALYPLTSNLATMAPASICPALTDRDQFARPHSACKRNMPDSVDSKLRRLTGFGVLMPGGAPHEAARSVWVCAR
eukprot:CAMPEP_0205912226 /NCGR_PEP_ID=MMETSP1325-20131115/5683_1 /ASSEMBLY_ACC=CAM_ASM_000708 /TAXON_ID=236786 /ORGANISM="Florenciella sp., Strain RCC1007" /LENGTH=103 /DNA_ID=CAMNT_0053278877 /DNA_START=304 /DNA_END=614 /DNA_ORIENTATION=-